jgi:hypothetical protein
LPEELSRFYEVIAMLWKKNSGSLNTGFATDPSPPAFTNARRGAGSTIAPTTFISKSQQKWTLLEAGPALILRQLLYKPPELQYITFSLVLFRIQRSFKHFGAWRFSVLTSQIQLTGP